ERVQPGCDAEEMPRGFLVLVAVERCSRVERRELRLRPPARRPCVGPGDVEPGAVARRERHRFLTLHGQPTYDVGGEIVAEPQPLTALEWRMAVRRADHDHVARGGHPSLRSSCSTCRSNRASLRDWISRYERRTARNTRYAAATKLSDGVMRSPPGGPAAGGRGASRPPRTRRASRR